jgi:hypothetical protein
MSLQPLLTVPENVRQAAEVIAGLDRCLLVGFGRLGPEQHAALQSLERVCSGTPLEGVVKTAVAAIGRSEFVDRHFAALAAARAALQGAQYDALRAQVNAALGRPTAPAAEQAAAPPPPAEGPIAVWQESARNWLMELALSGFQQLEAQTIAPFLSTLEHLQAEPRTGRLAAILTGFLNELLEALPVSALPAIPLYRWADLWTRSMLASVRPPAAPVRQKVSGKLTLLGADLRQHGYLVSCDLYALLETDTARTVRLTLSAFKVSVIAGADMWSCFPKETHELIRGLSQHLTFKIEDMTLLPGGALLWDGKASPVKNADIMQLAAQRLASGVKDAPAAPVADPVDRHPVQLAEPVYLGSYKATAGDARALDLGDGVALPVALKRLSAAAELKAGDVGESKAMLGLLRFDSGRWEVQPLAVVLNNKKEEVVFTGSGAYTSLTGKPAKTLSILKERASKLLRQKS